MVLRPIDKVLTGDRVRLGGYRNVTVAEIKVKVWRKIGMSEPILREMLVSSLSECVMGMNTVSELGMLRLPSFVK